MRKCVACCRLNHGWEFLKLIFAAIMILLAVYIVVTLPATLDSECCRVNKENVEIMKKCMGGDDVGYISGRNAFNDSGFDY